MDKIKLSSIMMNDEWRGLKILENGQPLHKTSIKTEISFQNSSIPSFTIFLQFLLLSSVTSPHHSLPLFFSLFHSILVVQPLPITTLASKESSSILWDTWAANTLLVCNELNIEEERLPLEANQRTEDFRFGFRVIAMFSQHSYTPTQH